MAQVPPGLKARVYRKLLDSIDYFRRSFSAGADDRAAVVSLAIAFEALLMDKTIYYCIRNYEGGFEALAQACRPLLETKGGIEGFQGISDKFDAVDGYGPTCVRNFVVNSQLLGDRDADAWRQDAFGQVDAWLKALGLRT